MWCSGYVVFEYVVLTSAHVGACTHMCMRVHPVETCRHMHAHTLTALAWFVWRNDKILLATKKETSRFCFVWRRLTAIHDRRVIHGNHGSGRVRGSRGCVARWMLRSCHPPPQSKQPHTVSSHLPTTGLLVLGIGIFLIVRFVSWAPEAKE